MCRAERGIRAAFNLIAVDEKRAVNFVVIRPVPTGRRLVDLFDCGNEP